jgi:GT2 family glycosyltransferase
MSASPSLACVILTQGTRPDELDRAVRSALGQDGDPIDVVVVANGCAAPELPAGARSIVLAENAGAPGGRNAAMETLGDADVVLFLDDDAWYPDTGTAEAVRAAFAADPRLGILTVRIDDPDGGPGQQRHVPRLGRTDPMLSSDVTTFLFGACAVRRAAFDQVGEFAAQFFFGHEESDFAWRVLDAGWRIHYDGTQRVLHPSTPPGRHDFYYRLNARNRVWLARRNLPALLVPVHLLVWAGAMGVRTRFGHGFRVWLRGFAEGLRTDPGPRRPMHWSTVWRMTRLGRPPIL